MKVNLDSLWRGGVAGGAQALGVAAGLTIGASADFVTLDLHHPSLIGRDGPLIGQSLQAAGVPVRSAATLDEAVALAGELAQAGDAVLLSPACASFDMFRSYEHRAQVFREAVQALARAAGSELETLA